MTLLSDHTHGGVKEPNEVSVFAQVDMVIPLVDMAHHSREFIQEEVVGVNGMASFA